MGEFPGDGKVVTVYLGHLLKLRQNG